jgi:cephalosporin hydroxylase
MYALLLRNTSVHFHRGDGAEVAVRLIREVNDPAPLCMLDGDHSYETVTRELRMISEAAPSATILVHDTFHQEGND